MNIENGKDYFISIYEENSRRLIFSGRATAAGRENEAEKINGCTLPAFGGYHFKANGERYTVPSNRIKCDIMELR